MAKDVLTVPGGCMEVWYVYAPGRVLVMLTISGQFLDCGHTCRQTVCRAIAASSALTCSAT